MPEDAVDGVLAQREAQRRVFGVEGREDRGGGPRRVPRLGAVDPVDHCSGAAGGVGVGRDLGALSTSPPPENAVRNAPGSTINTRIPSGPTSAASASE